MHRSAHARPGAPAGPDGDRAAGTGTARTDSRESGTARTAAGVGPFDEQVYDRLLAERIVFLGSEVRDDNANAICAQLLLLAAEDPRRDIRLYINSPGGSLSAGLAVYDTMQFVSCDVATVAMGMAASMGQFLLSAGTPGKRFALPHARIMMHQPLGGIGGTATDVAILAEQIAASKRLMTELTAAHTGQSVERIAADSERDRWFTAPQALDYGFIDHVVSSAAHVAPRTPAQAG